MQSTKPFPKWLNKGHAAAQMKIEISDLEGDISKNPDLLGKLDRYLRYILYLCEEEIEAPKIIFKK